MEITNGTADLRGSSRVAFTIREDPRLFLLQVKNEGHRGDYGDGLAV
jgi:hypothetical protein